MCVALPILPILSAVAGIASGVASYQGAQAQYAQDKATYRANVANAKTATYARYDSINNRVIQEKAAADQQLEEASIEGLKARASARTASAEGGVSGVSVGAIVRDMFARESRYAENTRTNFDYSRTYWAGEGQAAAAQGQSQINSVPKPQKPSFLPYAINMFGSAVKAFG